MVLVVGIPSLWAVVTISNQVAVSIFSGQIIFLMRSSNISAAVPGIDPKPACFRAKMTRSYLILSSLAMN